MSTYLAVNAQQCQEILSNYELGDYLSHEPIQEGITNTNYWLNTDTHTLVLTIFQELNPNQLAFFIKLLNHLDQQGLPVATMISNKTGDGYFTWQNKYGAVCAKLAGQHIDKPNEQQCRAIGQLLAKLHNATQNYPEKLSNSRDLNWCRSCLDKIKTYIPTKHYHDLEHAIDRLTKSDFSKLATGIAHCDVFRDNVLYQGDEVSGIIDFYYACTEVLLLDVACTINDWCFNQDAVFDKPLYQAVLDGYQSLRPMSEQEGQALPLLTQFSAARYWLSRLYDFHMPSQGKDVMQKDPRHFQHVFYHWKDVVS